MYRTRITALAVGLLAAASAGAGTVTVLEGFEANIDSVTPTPGGARPSLDPPGVTLSQYTTSGAEDTFVTEGQKCLQVVLSGSEWWSNDFQVTLSEEASAKLRQAQASGDVARYVLRWDYSFPPSGTTSWMNSQPFIVGVPNMSDQLDSNNGRLSHSITLDTIAPLPPEGPIVIQFAQNFDATADPFESLTVYVDNIRLIDTYATGAKPVIYTLQSFEQSDNPTGGAANFTGWGGGTRTTYSQYTKEDADDPRVTDGTHALKVDYANTGTWASDFTLPFAGTKLAEVLKLDLPAEERPTRAELSRYTLQFDVTYPERAEDWTGDWMNTSYHTQQAGLPFSQGGTLAPAETRGFRKTMSITLDEITWADWTDPKPSLMFIANGAWGPSGTTIYYDNFRLLDTGVASVEPPKISGIAVNAQGKVVITWTGGGTLQSTASLSTRQWAAVAGATSGAPIDPPAGGLAFYRVVAP